MAALKEISGHHPIIEPIPLTPDQQQRIQNDPLGWMKAHFQRYKTIKCSCGWQRSCYVNVNGHPNLNTTRMWNGHIEANSSLENTRVYVGKATYSRSIREYFVLTTEFARKSHIDVGPKRVWLRSIYEKAEYPWCVIERSTKTTKKDNGAVSEYCIAVTDSSLNANEVARKAILRGESAGAHIDLNDSDNPSIVALTPMESITSMLNLSDEVESVKDIQDCLSQINELLNLVPLLQSKRRTLESRLTSHLEEIKSF